MANMPNISFKESGSRGDAATSLSVDPESKIRDHMDVLNKFFGYPVRLHIEHPDSAVSRSQAFLAAKKSWRANGAENNSILRVYKRPKDSRHKDVILSGYQAGGGAGTAKTAAERHRVKTVASSLQAAKAEVLQERAEAERQESTPLGDRLQRFSAQSPGPSSDSFAGGSPWQHSSPPRSAPPPLQKKRTSRRLPLAQDDADDAKAQKRVLRRLTFAQEDLDASKAEVRTAAKQSARHILRP